MDPRLRSPRRRSAAAALAVAGLCVLTACGGAASQSATPGGGSLAAVGEPDSPAAPAPAPALDPIRLALQPDPIWQWLADYGTADNWETRTGLRVEASFPFDVFTAFAGGHADVVVINALDVEALSRVSDREPVIIGRHTLDRSLLMVRRASDAENLGDLVDGLIAVDSSLGSLPLWSAVADVLYGLRLDPDGGDFELVPTEPAGVADLVVRGYVDACICLPEYSIPYLASGRLRPLYDGAPAALVYSEQVGGYSGESPLADVLVAERAWYDQNREAARALLTLWGQGLARWSLASDQIIELYPHHFAVSDDAEAEWMSDYARRRSWFFPTAILTEMQAEVHSEVLDRLGMIGLLPSDFVEPSYGLDLSGAGSSAPATPDGGDLSEGG